MWFTLAGATSQPGQYPIDGTGLVAMNYVFAQAVGNATALTLKPGTPPQQVVNVIAQIQSVLNSQLSVLTTQVNQPSLLFGSSSNVSSSGTSLSTGNNANPPLGSSNLSSTNSAASSSDRDSTHVVFSSLFGSRTNANQLQIVAGGIKLPDDVALNNENLK
ncbi:MAG: hypothetical protein KGK17_06205 [Betaproteobacteria bacterium]|nr:hypothetical protein [Betaproteobacteria bacterium]